MSPPEAGETFLGGRVRVRQPKTGFRSGLDAVMLAAAVPARPGQAVLELGTGAGTASLCLATRVPGVAIHGAEIDPGLAELAGENAAANGIVAGFIAADIFALPPILKRDFEAVFCNPPFHDGPPPPDTARALALNAGEALMQWLKIGLQRTVSGGFFVSILRADRLDEALAANGARGVNIFPLWPKSGASASRVIVQQRKGSRAPLALLPGLVLHDADGHYTQAAEAVLREGAALAMDSARL